MAKRPTRAAIAEDQRVSASTDELMLAALERGGDTTKTGRYLMTFKEGGAAAGIKALQTRRGLHVASARDFVNQAVSFEQTTGADAVVFPEIGVALIAGKPRSSTGSPRRPSRRTKATGIRSTPNISCSRTRSIRPTISKVCCARQR